jgi:uncharacterized membrane protein HdeD (DUF308 family)
MLIIHISIALLSILSSIFLFFKPAKAILYITYSLVAMTFTSGTILVISAHSSIQHACISGIVYLAVVLVVIIPAQNKLKLQTSKTIPS